MSRIVPSVNEEVLRRSAKRCRERGVTVPTFAQMRDPGSVPESVKTRLKQVGLWDLDPANLFRITWKNDMGSGLFVRLMLKLMGGTFRKAVAKDHACLKAFIEASR